jgi:hypothetical protein
MICQELDGYMKHLCHNELMISWQISLTDGTIVYGDYEREGFDNPWIRLREYCKKNDVSPAKVELYMFGAEHKIFFENENGLDGISIARGVAKDQAIDGSYSKSYQTLTVCLLRDDCSAIDVAKYTWPHNDFEKSSSVRGLSTDNLTKMIFRNGSKKRNNPEVQKYLNGTRM